MRVTVYPSNEDKIGHHNNSNIKTTTDLVSIISKVISCCSFTALVNPWRCFLLSVINFLNHFVNRQHQRNDERFFWLWVVGSWKECRGTMAPVWTGSAYSDMKSLISWELRVIYNPSSFIYFDFNNFYLQTTPASWVHQLWSLSANIFRKYYRNIV